MRRQQACGSVYTQQRPAEVQQNTPTSIAFRRMGPLLTAVGVEGRWGGLDGVRRLARGEGAAVGAGGASAGGEDPVVGIGADCEGEGAGARWRRHQLAAS